METVLVHNKIISKDKGRNRKFSSKNDSKIDLFLVEKWKKSLLVAYSDILVPSNERKFPIFHFLIRSINRIFPFSRKASP